jgi:hypothetical protein
MQTDITVKLKKVGGVVRHSTVTINGEEVACRYVSTNDNDGICSIDLTLYPSSLSVETIE